MTFPMGPEEAEDCFNVTFPRVHSSFQERPENPFRLPAPAPAPVTVPAPAPPCSSSSSSCSPSSSSSTSPRPPANNPSRRQTSGSRPVTAPIAIAPKSQPVLQSSNAPLMDTYAVLPRPRLPPRSRNGCWTCRSRKVKCDEIHPVCGQCDRLQHKCDYTRRLSFRDDTIRVKQRNFEAGIAGSNVWDSQIPFLRPTPQELVEAKLLPPFSQLTNDEDRELKALLNKPGTYHVILGPKSFENAHDSETDGENYSSVCTTPGIKSENRIEDDITWDLPTFSRKASLPSKASWTDSESVITDDSETVFIRNFEDLNSPTNPKTLAHKQDKRSFSPETSDDSRHSSLANETIAHIPHQATEDDDTIYEMHYKRHISLRVMQIQGGFSGSWGSPQLSLDKPDIFETQSKDYPPLHEAMMALAAQNYDRETEIWNVKALERAQRALPVYGNMRVDLLFSDGLFSTHFLLLIYEITAAESWRDCLWQGHLDQMVRIILSRSDVRANDRQPFITWFLVVIDTYAALSASGNGALAETLEGNNLIPDAHLLIPSIPTSKDGGISEVERDMFIIAMRGNQRIILLGAKIAKLARDFRNRDFGTVIGQEQRDYRQGEIQEILEEMERLLWSEVAVDVESLKKQGSYEQCNPILKALYEEAHSFVHACVLYGNTSMYPSQLAGLTPFQENEINKAISAIIRQTKASIYKERPFKSKFLAFPLFLVGVMSPYLSHKKLAVEFLSILEQDCLGHNIKRLRAILQEIYTKQTGQDIWSLGVRGPWTEESLEYIRQVDWKEVLEKGCHRLVNFAF